LAYTDDILVYQREHAGRKFHVALNLSGTTQILPSDLGGGQVVISTTGELTGNTDQLGPHEGRILIP
jgi:hypothetical protein